MEEHPLVDGEFVGVQLRDRMYLDKEKAGEMILQMYKMYQGQDVMTIPSRLSNKETRLDNLFKQQQAAEIEINKPFLQEQELNEKCRRLAELDIQLNIDEAIDIKEHEQAEKPSILESLKNKQKEIGLNKQEKDRDMSL